MKDLVACYIGDGYCKGVSAHPSASGRRYWFPAVEEDHFCLAWLENVPDDVAKQLDDVTYLGGPLGPISDGYDLASKVAHYATGPVIVCTQEWDGPDCYLCGEEH